MLRFVKHELATVPWCLLVLGAWAVDGLCNVKLLHDCSAQPGAVVYDVATTHTNDSSKVCEKTEIILGSTHFFSYRVCLKGRRQIGPHTQKATPLDNLWKIPSSPHMSVRMQKESTQPLVASQEDARELRTQIQRLARRTQNFERYYNIKGRQLPLSYAQMLILLLHFHDQDTRPTLSDLVKALEFDKSNVTRLCQRLIDHKYVQTSRDKKDKRAKRIGLTPKGLELARHVDADSLERFDRLFDAFETSERLDLLTHLDKLNRLLGTDDDPF